MDRCIIYDHKSILDRYVLSAKTLKCFSWVSTLLRDRKSDNNIYFENIYSR